MPLIFDLLYREYCRACLAEMRKQLWLWPCNHEIAEANLDVSHADDAADLRSSSPVDAFQDSRQGACSQ